MTKSFDCMEMKHRGAEVLQKRLAGMTLEQEIEFWRKRSEEFDREQQRLRAKAAGSDGAGAKNEV